MTVVQRVAWSDQVLMVRTEYRVEPDLSDTERKATNELVIELYWASFQHAA